MEIILAKIKDYANTMQPTISPIIIQTFNDWIKFPILNFIDDVKLAGHSIYTGNVDWTLLISVHVIIFSFIYSIYFLVYEPEQQTWEDICYQWRRFKRFLRKIGTSIKRIFIKPPPVEPMKPLKFVFPDSWVIKKTPQTIKHNESNIVNAQIEKPKKHSKTARSSSKSKKVESIGDSKEKSQSNNSRSNSVKRKRSDSNNLERSESFSSARSNSVSRKRSDSIGRPRSDSIGRICGDSADDKYYDLIPNQRSPSVVHFRRDSAYGVRHVSIETKGPTSMRVNDSRSQRSISNDCTRREPAPKICNHTIGRRSSGSIVKPRTASKTRSENDTKIVTKNSNTTLRNSDSKTKVASNPKPRSKNTIKLPSQIIHHKSESKTEKNETKSVQKMKPIYEEKEPNLILNQMEKHYTINTHKPKGKSTHKVGNVKMEQQKNVANITTSYEGTPTPPPPPPAHEQKPSSIITNTTMHAASKGKQNLLAKKKTEPNKRTSSVKTERVREWKN